MIMAHYHMYIGTYTTKGGTGIEHYAFDAASGGFAFLDAVPAPSPSYLVFNPDRSRIYACLETSVYGSNGGVAAYTVEADGSLSEIDRADCGGVAPCHLLVHPSGKTIYIANYVSGSVTQFTLNPDGRFGDRTVFTHSGRSIVPVRQESPHCHNTVLMPDGKTLIVVDLGLDGLMQYPLDEDGRITGDPVRIPTPAGSGPRHIVFSADGRFAYVVCELGNRVLTYTVQGSAMELVDDLPTIPETVTERSACAAIRLTEDERFLYLTNRYTETLARFTVGPDGRLGNRLLTPTGGKTPRDCTVAPEGRFILCAHQDSDNVTLLSLDPETGTPVLLPTSITCSMPVAVLFGKTIV